MACRFASLLLSSTLLATPLMAQVTTDAGTISPEKTERFFNQPGYSPYAGRNFPTRPLWGEQHLHTSWSADAFGDGTRVGPDEAFRYAKGAEITSTTGQKVKLSRPYDWMVVADHSDAMGVIARVYDGDPAMMTVQANGTVPEALTDKSRQLDIWKNMTEIVESHNQPGVLSAIIGFEWTSNYGGGNNLHRNIIYRDDKYFAGQVRMLAIPHNGNLSNGMMFATETPRRQSYRRRMGRNARPVGAAL